MAEYLSLAARLEAALAAAVKEAFAAEADLSFRLAPPPDPSLGDFAYGCFPLAKALRRAPKEIAARLAGALEKAPLFEKVAPAGPYLNFTMDRGTLAAAAVQPVLRAPGAFLRNDRGRETSILVEYSAPNTNKPQHLGHVRNNVLGISTVNLLQSQGFRVTPVNLVNDRGIHICKSMLAYEKFGEGKTPEEAGRKGDHFVGDFYVRFAEEEAREMETWLAAKQAAGEAVPEDPEARAEAFRRESKWNAEARDLLRRWEAGDAAVRALWEKMNGWVYEGFDATYERLGCRFDKVYHESETYTLGKRLVLEGLEKGIFYRKEDGSVWVDLTEEGLDHKLLLRADGTSVYITQDLGTTKLKFDDFQVDRAVWIVADEQIYHFQVLFAALKKLGFPWAEACHHLAYGMVDLPEGKMKSRTGTVVDADVLMDELHAMEAAEIRERGLPIPPEDVEETAEILAQGALKFFILKFAPRTRMTFDPKESISPEGFTGPYVQYAYVRIRSIFRKAGIEGPLEEDSVPDEAVLRLLATPEEGAVLRRLCMLPADVSASAEGYNPARLCSALFELSRDYNRFYHAHPVLGAKDAALRDARLALSRATALALREGLALLGIGVPERM